LSGFNNKATISHCGNYRYWLERKWDERHPQVFIMLNPSTADANEDDRTIRRCINFAKRENAGGIIVVNLFAYRATNPKYLSSCIDPVGAENISNIRTALLYGKVTERSIICAWGANKLSKPEAEKVKRRAKDIGVKLVCFDFNADLSPKHPLYVTSNTQLKVYL